MADLTGQSFATIFPKLVQIDGTLQNSEGTIVFPSLLRTAGINFNASGGDTLDKYEVGTFTPTVTFNNESVGMTYSRQLGRYARFGNTVFYEIEIRLSDKGTSTGIARVDGYPFSSAGTRPRQTATLFIDNATMPTGGKIPATEMVENTTSVLLRSLRDTADFSFLYDNSHFNNNSGIILTGFYTV